MAKDSKLRDFYLPAVGIRDGDHRSSSSEDTLQRLAQSVQHTLLLACFASNSAAIRFDAS